MSFRYDASCDDMVTASLAVRCGKCQPGAGLALEGEARGNRGAGCAETARARGLGCIPSPLVSSVVETGSMGLCGLPVSRLRSTQGGWAGSEIELGREFDRFGATLWFKARSSFGAKCRCLCGSRAVASHEIERYYKG